MSFSLVRGKCIGYIVGGEYDGKYLRVYEDNQNYNCCFQCSNKCFKNKKKCCSQCKMSDKCCSINTGSSLESSEKIYNIEIYDGLINPVPNCEKSPDGTYIADCVYVAAPQGAGKSTILSLYIGEEKRVNPKKDVIIFSNFTEDKPLDQYKPMRIKLDEKIIKKPIKKEECKNSIVVFDDIDTLEPGLAKACIALRKDLLQCGRKENIKVLATSHQLMDYSKTRDLINSCNKIIIFPRATSPYHITRFLSTYIGLDKASIQYILKIPSRWILIDKTHPMYILYETGAIILNKLPELLEKGLKKKWR